MFWQKKKEKDTIKDPAVEYSKIINNNGADKSGKKPNKGWVKSSSNDGYDQGFVYYEE
ncbi:MAG: hypothetical protein ABIJ45_01370 [Candidatus Zixiibacteriota bacterium]